MGYYFGDYVDTRRLSIPAGEETLALRANAPSDKPDIRVVPKHTQC
jgi:hypothetical protein